LLLGVNAIKRFKPEGYAYNDAFYPMFILIVILGAAITTITLLRFYIIAAEKRRLLKGVSILFINMLIKVMICE